MSLSFFIFPVQTWLGRSRSFTGPEVKPPKGGFVPFKPRIYSAVPRLANSTTQVQTKDNNPNYKYL
jgi:hypothetical protein